MLLHRPYTVFCDTSCRARAVRQGTRRCVVQAPAAAAAPGPAGIPPPPTAAPGLSIPGSSTCSVEVTEVAPGLRGLRATRPVKEGADLLSLPLSHVLVVPSLDSEDDVAYPESFLKAMFDGVVKTWKSDYVATFEQQWQVHLPQELLTVLSDVKVDVDVRMAVLLLWVRRHVSAPFWQQYVQQLPCVGDHVPGTAWPEEAFCELQWPILMDLIKSYSSTKAEYMQKLLGVLSASPLERLQLLEGDGTATRALWALQAARTRCHADENYTVLVPYSDMANHSSTHAAKFFSIANKVGLTAVQHIREGQEVTLRYHSKASNEHLLHIWGMVERGNPNDWPYPIQRRLQLLPRLPWDVVLAAAGRLHDLTQLSPQELQQQQQQVPLSPGDLASLIDGQPVSRILAAASALPLARDEILELHGNDALDADVYLDTRVLRSQRAVQYLREKGPQGEPLWSQVQRQHILEAVRGSFPVRDGVSCRSERPDATAATAAAAAACNPQQRWEVSLAALTARLLGLHARLGLLGAPTTLEEDLAQEGAALCGGFAGWTPREVARLLGRREEGDSKQLAAHAQAVESLQESLASCTLHLAELQPLAFDSSSSHAELELVQTELAGLAAQLASYQHDRDHAPRRQRRINRLQEVVQGTASSAGAPAAAAAPGAGVDPRLLLAIQARLQQKMLLHVYGLLCDHIARKLQAGLA